jgi:ankyrin repeat protein
LRRSGETAMHEAAFNSTVFSDLVELLLEHGADVNTKIE